MKNKCKTAFLGVLGLFTFALIFSAIVAAGAYESAAFGLSFGADVITADNVFGTLATTIIIQKALSLVFTKRPILNRISLDLSDGRVKQGQDVVSRIHSVPAVTDFGAAATDRADVDVSVTVNQMKQVRHKFTFAEQNMTDRNFVEESADPMAVAIANHLVDAIAALWTPTNYAYDADATVSKETIEALADCDYQTAVTLRKVLAKRGAPDDRFLAVNSDVYEKLLVDPLIVSQNNYRKTEAIETGMIPNVAGFKGIFEYPALPAADNLLGFAGSKDSAVLAGRVPSDPRTLLPNAPFPGTLAVVREPTTGFAVLAHEYIDQDDLSANVRLIFAYGVAKGNANNGQRLVSATAEEE